MKKEIYELIKKEIDEQYLWLMDTKHTLYDIDIAFSAIKHTINKYIEFSTETYEDCISRAEAKRIVDYYIRFYDGQFRINESIDKLPSVQPKTDVLDKIRAEIEQKAKPYEMGGRGNGKTIRYGLCMALEIIDKYKAESEVFKK